jgi:Transglycosylase SLT domain
MRSIIACGIVLLGLNGTAHEPEYASLLSGNFTTANDRSASSLVEIDSSIGRADRLAVVNMQPRALALEIFRPTAADMQLRLASASPDLDGSLLASANIGPSIGLGDSRGGEVSLDNLCQALFASAQANDIPVQFFANLIWQESRLKADDVSKKGALGIAQFMPQTAAEKGLDDPFDPLQALPASARLLRELHMEFGNLGFVAAAYNAGPHRVARWLERQVSLPRETRNYVVRVTGLSVDAWRTKRVSNDALTFVQRLPCRSMPAFANVEQEQQALTEAKIEQAKLDDTEDVTGTIDDAPAPAADRKTAHKSDSKWARARRKHDAHRTDHKANHGHVGKREVEHRSHAGHEKRRV